MTEDRIVLTATDLTREAIDLLEAAEGIVVRSVVPKVEQVDGA